MSIRRFRKGDEAVVLELANTYASFDGTTSEADLAITGQFPAGFLVAEEGGTIVGFAYGYFRDIPGEVLERWQAVKVGHVALMAVAPGQRRRGIGTALLDRLLAEFRKAGADMVTLDCPVEATEAKTLYEKMGFLPRYSEMKRRLVAEM